MKEYSRNALKQKHTNVSCVRPSLALVRELFAMIVDPRRSCNEPGQEADGGAQTAGNRPNLQEERPGSVMVALIDQEELNY